MSSNDKKAIVSQEDIMKILDSCYEKCLNGIPKVSPNVEDMANDYLRKYATKVSGQGELLACIEVCPEEWSNRLIVTELWVSDELRNKGIGKRLMNKAKEIAINQKRRAVILETQSCNTNAIGFYLHEGFELIGFDTCCYTNNDMKRREVRINMGYFFNRENSACTDKNK